MNDTIKDGGPAFPTPVQHSPDSPGAGWREDYPGMSLRDWFAGQALAGPLASGPHNCDQHGLAHYAYLHADAMLKARANGGDDD